MANPDLPASLGVPAIHPPRVETAPVIDGVLDEKVWQTTPLEVDFFSFDPNIRGKITAKNPVLDGL